LHIFINRYPQGGEESAKPENVKRFFKFFFQPMAAAKRAKQATEKRIESEDLISFTLFIRQMEHTSDRSKRLKNGYLRTCPLHPGFCNVLSSRGMGHGVQGQATISRSVRTQAMSARRILLSKYGGMRRGVL